MLFFIFYFYTFFFIHSQVIFFFLLFNHTVFADELNQNKIKQRILVLAEFDWNKMIGVSYKNGLDVSDLCLFLQKYEGNLIDFLAHNKGFRLMCVCQYHFIKCFMQ